MATSAGQVKAVEWRVVRYLSILVFLLSVSQLRAQTGAQPSPVAPIVQSHRKVVVSIAHRKLALLADGKIKKVYPVAVGPQQSPTPAGTFAVKTRLVEPTYYRPGKV